MKLKTLKLFIIPIFILICTILTIYLFYYIYNSYNPNKVNNRINKFEDTPATTTTEPVVTAMSVPTEELVETCSASNNIVGFCMNYKGCCGQQSAENNKCFCAHPFVKDCQSTYEECTKSSADKAECKDKLKECCTSYNKINIDSSNFEKPVNQDQISQKLCAIGSINGLSTDSMRLKCMELCQTNTNCKAFSIDSVSCLLFSDINPLPTKAPNKPKPQTDYYIKK